MKRAFDEDSRRHLGVAEGGPPGYNNGDFLRKWALHEQSTAFKITQAGVPIGCIILWIRPDNINHLGCMFVDTNLQDKGMGIRIWKMVEDMYPQTQIWMTETPGFSKRNHNFYVNKCDFHIIKIENPGDKKEESYILKKVMNNSENSA